MKASGIKDDGMAEKTAPVAVADVLVAAEAMGVRKTEPPLPDPDPDPPPPPPRGDRFLMWGLTTPFLSATLLNLRVLTE